MWGRDDRGKTGMKTPNRRRVLAGMVGLAATASLPSAGAYPERPITLLVPFAPGGSTDILARIVAEHLQRSLKQPVVIENRTGASGNIGTAAVARSAPDGYTFLFNTMSVHTMNHALFAAMPFDGVKDFSPITLLAYVTNTMVIHPSIPAATVAEFIAYAKANPGKLAYASVRRRARPTISAARCSRRWPASRWCTCRIAAERLRSPTRSAGQTQLFFTAGTQSLEHVKAGRLRLLAVTEGERSPLMPDVPTVAETLPGYEMAVWYAAYRPGRHAEGDRGAAQCRDRPVLSLPEVKKRMADIAVETATSSPEELAAMTRADAEKWGGIIKSSASRRSNWRGHLIACARGGGEAQVLLSIDRLSFAVMLRS